MGGDCQSSSRESAGVETYSLFHQDGALQLEEVLGTGPERKRLKREVTDGVREPLGAGLRGPGALEVPLFPVSGVVEPRWALRCG